MHTYSLSIGYGRPLAQQIVAGAYDHVNEFLTAALFPVQSSGQTEVDAELVCFEHTASTTDVLAELEQPGRRPGRIEELLALGAAQPELQRSFPIVALGTVASYPHAYQRIPYLWGSPRVRHLDLRWDEHSWGANVHFLAICLTA